MSADTEKARADEALARIVDMFEREDFPARIAETMIARARNDRPMDRWSIGNQLLALIAGTGDARGYKQWQECGRQVVKGARAVRILAPLRVTRDRETASGELERVSFIRGFRTIPVFRLEDTDGAPVEYPDYAPPVLPPLHDVAGRLGVSVRYAALEGAGMRGAYSPGSSEIVLLTHDVDTWFHELAHRADEIAQGKPLKLAQDPAQEIVAETVSAVLCELYGYSGALAHCADYVRAYAGAQPIGVAVTRLLARIGAALAVILEGAGELEPAGEIAQVAA